MASVEPETTKAWSSRRRGSTRRTRRGGGEWRRGIPLRSRLGGCGSVESYRSGVRGRALAKKNDFFLLSKRIRTPIVATFVEN